MTSVFALISTGLFPTAVLTYRVMFATFIVPLAFSPMAMTEPASSMLEVASSSPAFKASPLFWVEENPRFRTANAKAAATITNAIRIIAVSSPVSPPGLDEAPKPGPGIHGRDGGDSGGDLG